MRRASRLSDRHSWRRMVAKEAISRWVLPLTSTHNRCPRQLQACTQVRIREAPLAGKGRNKGSHWWAAYPLANFNQTRLEVWAASELIWRNLSNKKKTQETIRELKYYDWWWVVCVSIYKNWNDRADITHTLSMHTFSLTPPQKRMISYCIRK